MGGKQKRAHFILFCSYIGCVVLCAQELCKRPSLNKAGFEMPTIFVPGPNTKSTRCANQIEDVCKDIEKTINLTVQNTLDQLEKDCDVIAQQVDKTLRSDEAVRARNAKASFRYQTTSTPPSQRCPFLVSAFPLKEKSPTLTVTFFGRRDFL